MKPVFADSFYFIALLNQSDRAHARAIEIVRKIKNPLLTTNWAITEVADAFATSRSRAKVGRFLDELHDNHSVIIIPPGIDLFRRALTLYVARSDKDWSLTDCISFIVMQKEGVTDALTGDRHFEQAGFRALLK
jgi:predicted nucleic acid-binding protein